MSQTILKKTIVIQSDPKTVWSYLTQPEKLEKWFHAPSVPIADGGRYDLLSQESGQCFMRLNVLEFVPYERLKYEFILPIHMPDTVSEVLWEISEIPGGCQVHLTHDKLPQDVEGLEVICNLDKGWDEHFAKLRAQLNSA